MKVRVLHYTPGEAAIASGRSVDSARNDRRAGYSEKQSGHARYDLLGVARLFAIQMFADRGIGPSVSVQFADEVAGAIAFHAAARGQLWTQDALDAAGIDPSSIAARALGSARELREFTELSLRKYGVYSGFAAGLVVWPTNEYDIITEGKFWDAYGKLAPNDPKGHGVVCMLQFWAMGNVLAGRMPRPIFDLEVEP